MSKKHHRTKRRVTKDEEIEKAVFTAFSSMAPDKVPIQKDAEIIKGLELSSDDASFVIMKLEKELKMRPSRKEWSNALTVQDAIDLFAKTWHADLRNQ
jgi:acyl carrier protein